MPEDKQAGDLYVELGSNFTSASRQLGTFIKRLENLRTTLKAIDTSTFATQFTNLSNSLKGVTSQDLKNITSLGKRITTLNKKMSSMDWNVIQSGFNSLTTSITPFIDKVASAETSLRSLNEILTKVSNKKLTNLSNINASPKSASRNNRGGLFGFLNVARWGATIYMARRLGRVVSDIAQSGADYTETLNLWETSMGTNVDLATKFVEKMNEAYGISEKTLMNAQATFKNMLGGLGNISDQMAYSLSEGITQMAVDYASLYNQTFEQAFTKFQAALAGQVRPIRSVSGFDITENTLFQLYQSLGGTKTMRQLNRTEKQLLSILAIFEQMTATGAVGDLNKTMDSFANQSRVMAESWQQVQSYAGVLLTYTIQETKLLTYVNAILIFIGDTLKAVAESIGAIQHFADPFEATTEGALTANDALDKVQNKLLDFDKFRALNQTQDTNALGLDEKLLKAFSNFDSILANASMEARELAEHFKIVSGLFDEDGTFNKERWDDIVDGLATFGRLVISLVASNVVGKLAKGITSVMIAGKGLNNILVGGIIWAIWEMVDAFREGDYQSALLAGTLGGVLLITWISLNAEMLKTIGIKISKFFFSISEMLNAKLIPSLLTTRVAVTGLQVAFASLGAALAISSFTSFMSSEASAGQKMVTMLVAIATAATAAAIAYNAFSMNWAQAIAVAGLVASGTFAVSSALTGVEMFKNGGLPDKGTVFMAGEAGAEIVYNTPSGQSGVVNVQQIKQAMYQALVEYGNNHSTSEGDTVVKIGEDEVFRATRKSAKRHGLDFVKAR